MTRLMPMQLKRRGVELRLVIDGQYGSAEAQSHAAQADRSRP